MLAALVLLSIHPGAARAQELATSEGFDGLHLSLAPVLGAQVEDGEFDSLGGGTLLLTRFEEDAPLSVLGASLGVTSFAKGDGYRLALETQVGTGGLLGIATGLSAAALLELYPTHRPLYGGHVRVWTYVGVAPYLGVAWLEGLGASGEPQFEIGLSLPISVFRL